MSTTPFTACPAASLAEGCVRQFNAGELSLAVYNIGGRFYATSDQCTHGMASLSEGLLDGDVIECDLHGGAFHVPTGEAVAPPCSVALRTYPVTLVGEDVVVELPA